MTWFKSFSDGKGGFNTFEWSLGDSLLSHIMTFVITFILLVALLILLPIILVFTHPYCSVKGMRVTNIVSIVLSSLFLIDYSIGYRIWSAFNVSPYMITIHNDLAVIHASLILINLLLLTQAKNLYQELNPNLSRALWFSLFILLFVKFVLCYNLNDTVIEMRSSTPYVTESSEK
jgi:hypothetical protein